MTECENRVPVCLKVPPDQEQSTASPGGKAKLSRVKGHQHWSGHTRVRALFTTGEAHLGPPTSAAAAAAAGASPVSALCIYFHQEAVMFQTLLVYFAHCGEMAWRWNELRNGKTGIIYCVNLY